MNSEQRQRAEYEFGRALRQGREKVMAATVAPTVDLDAVRDMISDILETLKILLRDIGCEYKEELVVMAREAVDKVVEIDLPFPNFMEWAIDSFTQRLGYAAIDWVAEKTCP